jgi:pSer/pThr/pTyr-binding forkhead associated (FHA) protein
MSMPELILEIVEGEEAGRQEALNGPIEIGRDASTTLSLQDEQMSRRHARVSAQGDVAIVEDLGSTNGTYVNEQPIEGPRELRAGDRIRVGLTVLEVRTAQDVQRQPSAVQPVPQLTRLSREVLEPASERELVQEPEPMQQPAAASGQGLEPDQGVEAEPTRPPSFAVEETTPGFVPPEVSDDPQARSDYNAVARLVDTRVKHQTQLAVFGLLAAAGLAVLLVFGLK